MNINKLLYIYILLFFWVCSQIHLYTITSQRCIDIEGLITLIPPHFSISIVDIIEQDRIMNHIQVVIASFTPEAYVYG